MKRQIIIAGHGGQGVLELGNYLSYLDLLSGRHVAYTPSYGPETRGGKVKCYVVTSDGEIDSPIAEQPDLLIVMNLPSMDFVPLLKRGGALLMNVSLIPTEPGRKDVRVFKVPATEMAIALKDKAEGMDDTRIVANSVMLGAYLAVTLQELDEERIRSVFGHVLVERKAALIELNMAAVRRGHDFAKAALNPPMGYGR